jgi:hypothetical protein
MLAAAACTLPKDDADPPFDAGGADAGRADTGGSDGGDAGLLPVPKDFGAPCFEGPFEISAESSVRELELLPVNEWLCSLTSVRGELATEDDRVEMFFDESKYERGRAPSSWILRASPGVAATAWCARSRCFVGVDRFVSVRGPNDSLYRPIADFAVRPEGRCVDRFAQLWLGDSVTFVSGLSGDWSSRDQRLLTAPSAHVCTDLTERAVDCFQTEVKLTGCGNAYVGATLHAFFAGTQIARTPAQFFGPRGLGDCTQSGEFIGRSDEPAPLRLAPIDSATCLFTGLSGALDGPGDFIEIAPMLDGATPVWALTTGAANDAGIEVRARCYAFAQSIVL